MNREEVLDYLVKHSKEFGKIVSINDWTFKNPEFYPSMYYHKLHDPITEDDWKRAKKPGCDNPFKKLSDEVNKSFPSRALSEKVGGIHLSTAFKINPETMEAARVPECDFIVGAKHDAGKPLYNLIPVHAEAELVDVLTFGSTKYAPNQWRNVENATERYTAAAMRHLAAYRMGETHDTESGKHHLAHAMCCLAFIIELDLEKE